MSVSSIKPINGKQGSSVYLWDASIYAFRVWFAMDLDLDKPPEKAVMPAALAYLKHLLRFIEMEQVEYMAAAFDESLGSGFRHQICDKYKANRVLPDPYTEQFLNTCKAMTEALSIKVYSSDQFEADDFIASLAKEASSVKAPQVRSVILTRDKDLMQALYGENDVWLDASKLQEFKVISKDGVADALGVKASQVADFLAIKGDKVDNIDGIEGVGDKTAAKLLSHFDSVDELLAFIDLCSSHKGNGQKELLTCLKDLKIRGAQKITERLMVSSDLLKKNLSLTLLKTDIFKPGEISLSHLELDQKHIKTITQLNSQQLKDWALKLL